MTRLFKEQSGAEFSASADSMGRFSAFLAETDVQKVIFEDTRKSTLTRLLKKAGFRSTRTYDFRKGTKARWRSWNDATPEDMRYFGVDINGKVSLSPANRRLAVTDSKGTVGEIAFTDYGRFVRSKANRFGSEGFAQVRPDGDPSDVLIALVREMAKEKKRYLILGPEYSPVSMPIHPFPLMHMILSAPKNHPHRCISAAESDLGTLAALTSDYEDIDLRAATERVTKNLQNPSFRYILSPERKGFALLRFMVAAEGMINDLYVSPGHQGKGIGDELTRGSLAMLSESCLNIHLNTIYPRARRLYEKYGFGIQYSDLCVALTQRTMVR